MTEISEHLYRTHGFRRIVTRHTPRGPVPCQECGKDLDYEYGSIRWATVREHLCSFCGGKRAADRALAKFREIYCR